MSQQIKTFEDIRLAKLRGAEIVDGHGDKVGWDAVEWLPCWLDKEGRNRLTQDVESNYTEWMKGMKVTDKDEKPAVQDASAPPGSNPKAKFGATKPNLGLIPPSAMLHEAMAFEDGARKYGPYNWRDAAPDVMTYVSAIKRHLDNFLDGEMYTADTHVSNLGAARAGLGILIDAFECNNIIDNRPPPGPSSELQDRLRAQKVEEAKARAEKAANGT